MRRGWISATIFLESNKRYSYLAEKQQVAVPEPWSPGSWRAGATSEPAAQIEFRPRKLDFARVEVGMPRAELQMARAKWILPAQSVYAPRKTGIARARRETPRAERKDGLRKVDFARAR